MGLIFNLIQGLLLAYWGDIFSLAFYMEAIQKYACN